MDPKNIIKNHKTVRHYTKLYFISIIIGLTIVGIGYFVRQETMCANSKTCESDLLLRIDNDDVGFFMGYKVIPPKVNLNMKELKSSPSAVTVSKAEKHIYVDLSGQTLYAYEGNEKFMQTPISSGRWAPTPIGNYNIWIKLPVTRMAGGEGADAYDLPNVPWVMYFYRDFGLHGAYWHDNFGHPMSHGCVNMRIIDAHELYNWADGPALNKQGTAVSVCNQFVAPNKCVQN
jgi:lipoprotein-anchoring transpeptidase ErfK/SrfK